MEGERGQRARASFSQLPGSRSLVLGLLNFVLSDGRRRRLRSLSRPLQTARASSPAAHIAIIRASEVGREGLLGSAGGGGALSFPSLCVSLGPPGDGKLPSSAMAYAGALLLTAWLYSSRRSPSWSASSSSSGAAAAEAAVYHHVGAAVMEEEVET